MTEVAELVEYVCPNCAAVSRLDPRFARWCVRCEHGADPYPPTLTRRRAKRRDRETARAVALFESLQTQRNLRPSSALGYAITALSLLVHLIGVLPLVAPVLWLLSGGPAGLAWVAIFIGLMTFLTVRPRLPRRRLRQNFGFGREQAPHLYALLDRCAAELGAVAPDRVAVDAHFNASTGRAGLARSRFLIIGAPMWAVLTGPERICLLGHELGHQVNGDATRSLLAGTADTALTEWTRLLYPQESRHEAALRRRFLRRGTGVGGLASVLSPIMMALCMLPFFLVALGCRAGLNRLALHCGQRAEYLADELGARLAGTEASLSLISKHTFAASLNVFVGTRRGPKGKQRPDTLWADFREYAEGIPDAEIQRRLIVDRMHNTRTDRGHPADHLRLALHEDRPAQLGAVSLTDAEWAAIDAELAPRMTAAARYALR